MRHSHECLIFIHMVNTTNTVYSKEEYITGETLYQYLHISKRKMKFLLENGYIPYIDTGKKTHRYIIKITDAEEFKLRLATDGELIVSIQGNFGPKKPANVQTLPIKATKQNSEKFMKYLQDRWSNEPDAMPAKMVAALVGFPSQRIYDLCERKKIFSVRICDRIYCSKDSVIAYFAAVERIAKPFTTQGYRKLMDEFIAQL